MIAAAIQFLRRHLDRHLRGLIEGSEDGPVDDKIAFVDGDEMDPLRFKPGAVTLLLINIEEDKALRSADPYLRREATGDIQRVQPDIHLNLYVLFVARFKEYDAAWRHLSYIIEYLQGMRVIDRAAAPDLPDNLDRISVELVTQTFAEQNEVWNALRTTLHPSVLYRFKVVTYRDGAVQPVPAVQHIGTSIRTRT